MRHLVVIVVVIYAVIGDGWAQNRGSVRYVPPEDFDGDITRAPRPTPTRGAAVRRQRPTKAPETTAVEDELKAYQPPESPVRTTGRRVPQRTNVPHVPSPISPPVPVEDAAPRYAPPVEEPQIPSTKPEGVTQGTRRRRPKKRRRPQNSVPKIVEDTDKQAISAREEEKSSISELLNEDKKRSGIFDNNPASLSNPSTYNSDPNYQLEKASWDNNSPSGQHNAVGSQYYNPQPATNRLPLEDSEPIVNPQGYLESSPGIPRNDAPAPFVPNAAPYVPVLSPVRLQSGGASRLPPEDYSSIRNQDSVRPSLHLNYNVPHRGHSNRSPVADPEEEIIMNTGAKLHNVIPQSDQQAVPLRSHSEVRLPEKEQSLLSPEYASSSFDSSEDLSAPIAKGSEEIKEPQGPSNRLPNPSEIHYDSVYPEYSDDSHSSQRIAGRRQELVEPSVRNQRPSYTAPRRDTGTKPQEYDNDAEVDRQQTSQYRPPLQRAGSRYKSEDVEGSRSRTLEHPPSTSAPRTRGLSRYQPSEPEYVPERTRNPTRTRSNPPTDYPTLRATTTARARGSQRYVPETVESEPQTNSRRQLVNTEELPRNSPSVEHVPDEDVIKSQLRSPFRNTRPPTNLREESEQIEHGSIRNTLRSRPQYEVREPELPDSYEESVDEPDVYNPNYQLPGQTDSRGRTSYRTSLPAQQPPQPEYQLPPNRQQNRQEPQYEPPQNPRSRHQPQYQAPQNPRSEPRQTSSRQNQNSRPQGRTRHQNTEPSPPPRRSSSGSSFACPDSYGFYADPVQCDKYYECRNGTAEMHLCNDGLAFNVISSPKYLRCDSLRDVDCKSRSELQEPQSSKNCPRKFGLFPHETDCTKFWNCVDGAPTEVQCPPGLTYNDERATCDWADLVESSCKTEDLLGFTCPEPTSFDLQDGVYSRYPHPDNCQLHFTCIKGADGLRRPRMLSCNEGLVFDPTSSSCKRPEEVPGCEDFYGVRSPAPKRKPSRQPEPEPEEIEEPRPRRRGSNRRARN